MKITYLFALKQSIVYYKKNPTITKTTILNALNCLSLTNWYMESTTGNWNPFLISQNFYFAKLSAHFAPTRRAWLAHTGSLFLLSCCSLPDRTTAARLPGAETRRNSLPPYVRIADICIIAYKRDSFVKTAWKLSENVCRQDRAQLNCSPLH